MDQIKDAKPMAYRDKKQKHQIDGVTTGDMNALAALLLQAFQGSIQQQLDETGEVNPRLLAEAVKWLSNSGVTLKPDNEHVADLGALTRSLEYLYADSDETYDPYQAK